MRLRVVRDGRTEEVEVSDDLSQVTIGGRTYPVQIVRKAPLLVELEIAGERVVVDQWPDHFPEPPGPVDVNGERGPVRLERVAGGGSSAPRGAAPAPATKSAVPPAASGGGRGTPVLPPMPGKVVELRVKEGQAVAAGEVLLVVEAMKMRNEVAAPHAGTVRDVRVQPGTSARAKEPLLFVEAR
jgi:glutaconyl-CoA/methylmalonyl-CoA decarboxylase subunit gamma